MVSESCFKLVRGKSDVGFPWPERSTNSYIYTAFCKNFEPPRIYIDIYLYLRAQFMSGAVAK